MLQLPKASMLTLKETSGIKNANDSTIITLKILLPNFPFGTPNPQTVTIHCHICLFFFFFPNPFFPKGKKKSLQHHITAVISLSVQETISTNQAFELPLNEYSEGKVQPMKRFHSEKRAEMYFQQNY